MAKGQMKSNKEARKPKAEKKKTIAANPSTKEGVVRGLDNMKKYRPPRRSEAMRFAVKPSRFEPLSARMASVRRKRRGRCRARPVGWA